MKKRKKIKFDLKDHKYDIVDRPSLRTLLGKKDLVGAEIGIGPGANALNMLEHLDIKKLYLIDPYYDFGSDDPRFDGKYSTSTMRGTSYSVIGWAIAEPALKPYCDKVVWINEISYEAVDKVLDEELDFVYIDGSHSYQGVKEDVEKYWTKVKFGGLIAGHDYNRDAVKDAISDALNDLGISKEINSAVVESNPRTEDWWITKK